ncbi:MAG: hypothetical protein ACRC37_03765 [Lentisphaeria bacterium]
MKQLFILLLIISNVVANLKEVAPVATFDATIIPLSMVDFKIVNQYYQEIASAGGELRLLDGGANIYIKDRYDVVAQVREFIDYSKRNQKKNVVIIEYLTSRFGINKHLDNENDAKIRKPVWRVANRKVTLPMLLGFRAKGIELKKAQGPFSENDLITSEELLIFNNTQQVDMELLFNILRSNEYYLSDGNTLYTFEMNEHIEFKAAAIKIKITNLVGNRFGINLIPYIYLKIAGKEKTLILSSLAIRVTLKNEEHFALGAYLYSQRNMVETFYGKDFFEDNANRNRANCFIRCISM